MGSKEGKPERCWFKVKISRLEIRNCLGIKELELQAGKLNIIKGGNERGKTSVLEAIEKAFYNTSRRPVFVRSGEAEGTLYVELDDGVSIDRKIKSDGKESVKVTKGTDVFRKPETALKSLVGEFSFNPVDFMQKKDKEQTEILLSLIPMHITKENLQEWFGEVPQVNLNQHAIEILTYLAEKYFYDRRTLANGEVKECQAEIESLRNNLPDNYDPEEWRDVNLSELFNAVREAEKSNHFRVEAQKLINNLDGVVEGINNKYDLLIAQEKQAIDKEIENLRAKISALEAERGVKIAHIEAEEEKAIREAERKAQKAQEYLDEIEEKDTEQFQRQAEKAERMKSFVPLADNLNRAREKLTEKQQFASWLNDCVATARQKPTELLADLEMPVKGLGINEQMQITIDGLPIKNLSTSRQLRLALDIARATAGKLKLICVDRFESLDPEVQNEFYKEIAGDEYQYFISQVDAGELKVEVA